MKGCATGHTGRKERWMTNGQIIADAAVSFYGKEAVARMLADGGEIPMHTARGWADRGLKVKSGERGLEVKLWKKKRGNPRNGEDEGAAKAGEFFKARAFLFGADQVEDAEE